MQAPWSKPVLLALEEPGQYVTISTTQAASWALIEDWPVEDGPALDRALLVCADVIKGTYWGGGAEGVYRSGGRGEDRDERVIGAAGFPGDHTRVVCFCERCWRSARRPPECRH
jgi:hypothetical protein